MADEPTYVGPEEEYAPFWQPTPGETISGKMVSVHVMQGDYGPTPVVTVEVWGGDRLAILVRGTVFREEMAQRRPKPGDDLSVTYLGTKSPKSGKGKPYHVYRVQGGTEPEFNWNDFTDRGPSGQDSALPEQDSVPIEPARIPQPVGQAAEQRQQQESAERSDAAAKNFGEAPF